MIDRRLEGMPIMKQTGCRVGMHSFTWTSGSDDRGPVPPEPPRGVRCDCGAYTWQEWLAAFEAPAIPAEGAEDGGSSAS